jgi:thiamine biosynthesis lipoprotein
VLAVALTCVLVSSARADEAIAGTLQRFSRTEVHMGVEFEVVLYCSDMDQAMKALTKAMARVAALDKALSDYDLESELSQLSATSTHSGPEPPARFAARKVSDDLWAVLAVSEELSQASGGAFDVTIGPLTKLWRRARRWKELPDAEQLTAAKNGVGHSFLKLDREAQMALLVKPNMRLDLGGIAKGYAAEEAVKTVVASGIPRVLARGSGDIYAGDPPPGDRGWRIGIAPLNPRVPPTRFVEIANRAISTSGDARQHLVVEGKRYSHILDPRTGSPVSGKSSVTVIAASGVLADGLDTAASVLGPAAAESLVSKYEGAALFMVYEDEQGRQQTVESPGFAEFEIAGVIK